MTHIYQKNEAPINRVTSAGAMAVLVYLSGLLSLYPAEWQMVVPIAVFAVGCVATSWGYALAVGSLAYPLFYVSPYLLALFLAVTIIPLGWIVRHIWVAILVAATPLLADYGLLFVAPLMSGLVLGSRAGLIAGVTAKVWLTLLASFSYGPAAGAPQGIEALRTRFGDAGSFGTVGRVIEPFFPSSVGLLANLLQIVVWAGVGWLVGWLAEWGAQRAEGRLQFAQAYNPPARGRQKRNDNQSLMAFEQICWRAGLPLLVGGALLTVSLSYLPALLNQPLGDISLELAAYGVAAAASGLVALAGWLLLWYLHQPVSEWGRRSVEFGIGRTGGFAKPPAQPAQANRPQPARQPVRSAPATTMLEVPTAGKQKQQVKPASDERVIMIEID